jgi:hypothetical protein
MPIDLIGGPLGLGVDQGETGRNPQWAGGTDSTDTIVRADRTSCNRVDHRQDAACRPCVSPVADAIVSLPKRKSTTSDGQATTWGAAFPGQSLSALPQVAQDGASRDLAVAPGHRANGREGRGRRQDCRG